MWHFILYHLPSGAAACQNFITLTNLNETKKHQTLSLGCGPVGHLSSMAFGSGGLTVKVENTLASKKTCLFAQAMVATEIQFLDVFRVSVLICTAVRSYQFGRLHQKDFGGEWLALKRRVLRDDLSILGLQAAL